MNPLKKEIIKIAEQITTEIIHIRRHIHTYPELSFYEKNTSTYISQKLTEWGITHQKGFATNGILGIIKGEKKQGKTIALRADMDALPIQEKNKIPFKSKVQNVMHACGHDIHTASLLGVAKILQTLKSKFGGTILLVFQPAEEKLPGGAKLMLEDGIFDLYKPDFIIGQHVCPDIQTGKIGMYSGSYMASADEVYISIKGKGGHAALPHKTPDTVLAACQTVVALQQVVSRFIPPQIPAVLSFGNIVCQSMMNIIPKEVELQGTLRTMDEEWRYKAHEQIKNIAKNTCKSIGVNCKVNIKIGYPCLYNNPKLTQILMDKAIELHGKEQLQMLEKRMTAEDFAWFAQKIPACFYRLGVGYADKTKNAGSLHSCTFLPNEESLKIGMQTMSYFALNSLEI